MTIEEQLRVLAEASVAEQRPVSAEEVFDRLAGRDHATPSGRRAWLLVAATLTLVIGGIVTLLALRDTPEQVPTPVATVPNTGPDSTVSATTAPDTALATSAPPSTTTTDSLPAALRPSGDEIRVAGDAVEFGEGLAGGGREGAIFLGPMAGLADIDRLGDRTYVLAGSGPPRTEPYYVNTEVAVLAAFDSTGSELWRIELDGRPADMVAAAGAVWVVRAGAETLTQVDAGDGHVVGEVDVADVAGMIGAYDAVWLVTVGGLGPDATQNEHPVGLVRVNADLTATAIEIAADRPVTGTSLITAGAGSIWMPMGVDGLAAIDPETLETTWISPDTIGHDVRVVAVDGDAVFVASDDQITALVDGEVRATTTVAGGNLTWGFLGHVDGRFGFWASSPPEGFTVLRASDPMVVEVLQIDGMPVGEIDGAGWAQTGPLSVGRVRLLPDSLEIPPSLGWTGPVNERGVEVYPMSADEEGTPVWHDPADADDGWVDITSVGFPAANHTYWRIQLAVEPPPVGELDPGTVIAYGLVLDTTGDGVGDHLVGIDTDSPGPGDFRVWVTDLATGETRENSGPSYGLPIEFSHPSESPGPNIPGQPPTMVLTFLSGGSAPDGLDRASVRFYAWASLTRDGELTAWDYAPDTGWIGS
jgi:hypothetical protein